MDCCLSFSLVCVYSGYSSFLPQLSGKWITDNDIKVGKNEVLESVVCRKLSAIKIELQLYMHELQPILKFRGSTYIQLCCLSVCLVNAAHCGRVWSVYSYSISSSFIPPWQSDALAWVQDFLFFCYSCNGIYPVISSGLMFLRVCLLERDCKCYKSVVRIRIKHKSTHLTHCFNFMSIPAAQSIRWS